MLLPVRTGLFPSAVFEGLNALLREIILASCAGRAIDEFILPNGFWNAVQENKPTRERLQALEGVIATASHEVRYELYLGLHGVTSVRLLFGDSGITIPDPPEDIKDELKKSAVHLFERTSKLVGVARACGETVMDHYIRYSADKPPGNGNVCGMCATELLAQRQSAVSAENQWRAPYDHLLAKETYPQFGVDPGNLLPICHTCNSKAKLAKDLLRNSAGLRRTCFDPWVESAHGQVVLQVDLLDISPKAICEMVSDDPVIQSKLITWNDVYRIKERVEGEFLSLREKLAEDLELGNLALFKRSIESKKAIKLNRTRLTPYNYWRSLLYSSLLLLPDQQLEQLRALCLDGLDPNGDAAATYGI